jgi:hypothetical protein
MTYTVVKKEHLAHHGASSGTTPLSLRMCKFDLMFSCLLTYTHLTVVPENSMMEAMAMAQVSSLMVVKTTYRTNTDSFGLASFVFRCP